MDIDNNKEKIELNLDNPIFVCYLDCKYLTPQEADRLIERAKKLFSIYSNITVWVMAADRMQIECIYGGNQLINDQILSNFDNFGTFIQSESDFKQKLRELLITDFLDETS